MSEEIKRCGRCNRKLKDAQSKERGYGPVCWSRVQEDNAEQMVIKNAAEK